MRYAKIDEYEVVNGRLAGQSLYVQGCRFHCPNCFNSDIWDFQGGKEWTSAAKKEFLDLSNRQYIKRISILGGEPLADENVNDVCDLLMQTRNLYPDKKIWLYTGYTWEELIRDDKRKNTIKFADVLVDGRYVDLEKDASLKWKGSRNQRVIDVQQTIKQGVITLWET